jgi:uncharacterized RDD family membrane protein YckC
MFGEYVALGFLDEGNELAVGCWPITGGAAVVEPAPVTILGAGARPWIGRRSHLLAYGLLSVILVTVFLRRRESLVVPAQLPATQVLATYLRRLLSFAMDVLISMPLVAAAVVPVWPRSPEGRLLAPEGETLLHLITPGFLLAWLVGASVFVIYLTMFEAAMGATPGKRLNGCQVVDERGQRCRFRAILLRNVVRFVELFPAFQLMPAILLIILTRNRQRLGDLVARTLVVERRAAAASDQGPDTDGGAVDR